MRATAVLLLPTSERRLVWVHWAGKVRPGVVLRLALGEPSHLVLYGTTHMHPTWPAVFVAHASRAGKRWQLTQDTWFYGANFCVLRVVDIVRSTDYAPPGLFAELTLLARPHLAPTALPDGGDA